jgi:isoamylase
MSVVENIFMEKERFAKTRRHEHTGQSHPLGATVVSGGVNFSIFSRGASSVELLLFDRVEDGRPVRVIQIDPADNRTYHYWHSFVPDVQPGQIYGFRVHGPFDPANGLRFDPR